MNLHSCLFEIQSRYESLTPVEKRIADYIAEHSEEVIHMTARELAAHADTAGSAVLRCCKSLGFSGFPALKISLSADISKNMQLNYSPYIDAQDTPDSILDKVFSANVKTLHDTAERIDRKSIIKAVEAIRPDGHIYIYAVGTSAALAMDFQYRLIQIGYHAFCFTDVPTMKVSTLNIAPGDVAIGITHTGRTIPTIESLKLAKAKGAVTACITSFPNSPIVSHCDAPISTYSDEIKYPVEAVSARIAHISVMDTIVIALSAKNYEETVRRSKLTHEYVDTIRYGEASL